MGKQSTLLGFFGKSSASASQAAPTPEEPTPNANSVLPTAHAPVPQAKSPHQLRSGPETGLATGVEPPHKPVDTCDPGAADAPHSDSLYPEGSSDLQTPCPEAGPHPEASPHVLVDRASGSNDVDMEPSVSSAEGASNFASKSWAPSGPTHTVTPWSASLTAPSEQRASAPETSVAPFTSKLEPSESEDEIPGVRRTRRRAVNYVESESESDSGSDSDSDAVRRAPPSKRARLNQLARKRRTVSSDEDDFAPSGADSTSEASDVDPEPESESAAEESDFEEPLPKSKPPPSAAVRTARQTAPARPSPPARRPGPKAAKGSKDEPFSFLHPPRDKDGNVRGSPLYDPRTLLIPPDAWGSMTPFEQQFWELKQDLFDTVLFIQKGNFYELYEDDATLGHQILDLKLVDYPKMRMVGVPEKSYESFAAKFLALGYKVGRVDQDETGVGRDVRTAQVQAKGKTIVQRTLRHVLTSGTIVEPSALQDDQSSYCVCIKETLTQLGPAVGVCILDAATAEFRLAYFEADETRGGLETLLRSLRVREVLLDKCVSAATLGLVRSCIPSSAQLTQLRTGSEFPLVSDAPDVLHQFFPSGLPCAVESLAKRGESMAALGAMLLYLRTLNLDRDLLASENVVLHSVSGQTLQLDAQTLTHLNVLSNDNGTEEGTLHALLNRCHLPFGKRLLRQWLLHPLVDLASLNARLDAVQDLLMDEDFHRAWATFARTLPDVERVLPRVRAGRAKPRDFVDLLEALAGIDSALDQLQRYVQENHGTRALSQVLRSIPSLTDAVAQLRGQFVVSSDGGFEPVEGTDENYDRTQCRLAALEHELDELLADIAAQLKVPKSKVVYRHSGTKEIYQVEVPRATKVPPNWILLGQTKEKARHYPPDVKRRVQALKEAREARMAALAQFRTRLFDQLGDVAPTILLAACKLGEVDCLVSLAKASEAMGSVVRPKLLDADEAMLHLTQVRHPTLCTRGGDFIPNNVRLGGGGGEEFMLLTGGNMAGKSTLARTAATAVLLAQVGCFVPADQVTLVPVDRIASRMGANDQLFHRQSTFMVEMMEASRIIAQSTPRSLVILDELGRGTSTYDGQAIAHAVLHHLLSRTRCIGFFLTHYTSLAREFASYPRVANHHMKVLVSGGDDVTFTYKLVDGVAEASYGTQVAALAGVGREVTSHARAVSQAFQSESEKGKTARIKASTLSDFAFLVGASACQAAPAQLDVVRQAITWPRQADKEPATSPEDPASSPAASTSGTSDTPTSPDLRPSSPPTSPPHAVQGKRNPLLSAAGGKSLTREREKKATQSFLFAAAGSKNCTDCGMSYDPVSIEDRALHTSFHARATEGVLWPAKWASVAEADDLKDDSTHVLVYSYKLASGELVKALDEIVTLMDDALGAAPVGPGVKRASKVLVARRKGRVVGSALLSPAQNGAARKVLLAGPGHGAEEERAIEAVFVDRASSPYSPAVAIQRIWVLPSLRGAGLGRALLDAALEHAVYGMDTATLLAVHGSRAKAVAFSQPTFAGRRLAQSWIRVHASALPPGESEEERRTLLVLSE